MTSPLTLAIREYDREAVPDHTRETAKNCILDTLGCLLAGDRRVSSDRLRAVAGDWRGDGHRALLGATAAHSVEMDDFHNGATVHPGVVVVPAALEAALAADADGATFLDAVLVGYETAIRVGLAGCGTYYDRGFHATSTAGVFGATAAAGYLTKLDDGAFDDAFGIAGSNAGGLLEYKADGSWTKRLQVGMASETGVRAAALADGEFTGPSTVLEGRYGFLGAYPTEADASRLDPPWGFDSIDRIAYKPYACCRYTHAAIDAFLDAWERLDASVGDVESIEVETHRQAVDSTASPMDRKRRPDGAVDAQFSLPFVVGVAAVHGSVLPEHLVGDALRDETVLGVADRVSVAAVDRFTESYPETNAASVAVTAAGRTESAEVKTPSGDPERPLARDDLRAKFADLAAPSVANPDALADRVLSVESADDVAFLGNLLPGGA